MKGNEIASLLAALTSQQQVLCGLEKQLPEPWRAQCVEMRGKFDRLITTLPETEKPDAAREANWGINYLARAIQDVLSVQAGLGELLKCMGAESERLTASLPAEVVKAIESQVKDGKLLTAEGHAAVLKQSLDAQRAQLQLESNRQRTLVTAGLPLPTDDTVLAAEDFEARQTEAARRVQELGKRHLDPVKHRELCWAPQNEFERQMGLVDAALAAAKSQPPGKTTINPMANVPGAVKAVLVA